MASIKYGEFGISVLIFVVLYQWTNVYSSSWIAIIFYLVLNLRLGMLQELFTSMKVLPRDVCFIAVLLRQMIKLKLYEKKSLIEVFELTAMKHPNKIAIIDAETDKRLTFQEFKNLSYSFANIFVDAGFKKGDIVAIFLPNRLEYIPLCLGLWRLGVITALININLKRDSLDNSLKTSKASAIIFDISYKDFLYATTYCKRNSLKYYSFGSSTPCTDNAGLLHCSMETLLSTASSRSPTLNANLSADHPLSYIYTSGTNGYPKAAVIPCKKYMTGYLFFVALTHVEHDDIVYNTLPMYHTSGNLIFFSATIIQGCTMIIREKFSVSSYFKDCIKHNVTYAGYIGEMWRYLLAQPLHETDKQHCIRRIVGNGLRRSLFEEVKERYNIPFIHEFYGGTEFNTGFINYDSTSGAVGFRFKCFPFLNFTRIVKVDQDTGTLLRDQNGLAIECQVGEQGMLVANINKVQSYYGYTNKQESDKKIEFNVFKKGDCVFLTGDILQTDKFGYLYFVDRMGDTFRWKGENVATTEIENTITTVSSGTAEIFNVIVYPVKIPLTEGSTGMAYLQVLDVKAFDIQHLIDKLVQELPKYAIPIFYKIGQSVETTGTFKYIKVHLKQQGFKPSCCSSDECLYMYDVKTGRCRILDEDLYEKILNGAVGF